MDFKEQLLSEEKSLSERLTAVRATLRAYGFDHISLDDVVQITHYSNIFPTKATKERQILWLFENRISKAIKLKGVQDLYNEALGNDKINIDNTVRRLRKESKLLFVKYNDKNILSYWGLPTWIEGNDFKDQYKPDADTLPEITSSEVNIGDK